MSQKKIILICLVILLVSAGIVYATIITEPTAKSEGATKKTAMLVSVQSSKKGNYNPVFKSTGTVAPVEDVQLNPLVNGPIIKRFKSFAPGEIVKKGQTLLQINPADLKNNLALRQSELQQAKTNYQVELGRQAIAEQDLQLIGGDSLSESQQELVTRKPQLSAVKANVASAQAAVDQAQLDLKRTQVKAPFDAQVISQNVTTGAQVDQSTNLGRLVGIYEYWVEVNLPTSYLKWISFEDDRKESKVQIFNPSDWGNSAYRKGKLHAKIGSLNEQTRLARILIKVQDPLALRSANKDKPELLIGSFVEVDITGNIIKDVIRVDRDHLRSNNTLWVMENGKLSIRQPKIVLLDSKFAYVAEGLKDGEKLITSNISTVTEGIAVQTEESESDEEQNTPQ